MARDFDLERIEKIAEAGLADSREDAPDDLALDSFIIVAVFTWTTNDGEEREGAAVWSETRRNWAKLGLLEVGHDRVLSSYSDEEE